MSAVRAKLADTVIGHYGFDFTVFFANQSTRRSATTVFISL
jgi:hypothetical protein